MTDIHPIKNTIELSVFTDKQVLFFYIFCAVFFGIFLIFLIYFLFKKYYSKKEIIEEKEEGIKLEKADYQKQATEALKKTKAKIELELFDDYYLEVTEIIKKYLTNVYQENYIDFTTYEILEDANLSKDFRVVLEDFLETLDLAKFSKKKLNKKKLENIYEAALEIIQK